MKTRQEVEMFCDLHITKNFKLNENGTLDFYDNFIINDDNSVDVMGDIDLSFSRLTEIPIKFNRVDGFFLVNRNNLTTLKGCPEYIGGIYNFSDNNLPSCINHVFDFLDREKVMVFLKYHDQYDLWLNGFDMDNYNILLDDINKGLL